MLLPVKLICRTKRVHEDGTCTIFIQYCYGDKKVLLHTGIKVSPCFWNRKQQCIVDTLPTEHGVASKLNNELLRMRSVVNSLALGRPEQSRWKKEKNSWKLLFLLTWFLKTLKKKYREKETIEKTRQQTTLGVYYQLDEYIKSKQRKVGRATLTVYANVKSHLLAFEAYRQQKITFDSFNFGFYEVLLTTSLLNTFTYAGKLFEPVCGLIPSEKL